MLTVYIIIILVTILSSILNFHQGNVSHQIRQKHGFASLLLGAFIDTSLITFCYLHFTSSIIFAVLTLIAWIFDIHYNNQAKLEVMSHRVDMLMDSKSHSKNW